MQYFYTKNKSSIVAFIVGGRFSPGNGFKIIGAHTDSPNLKLKPVSKREASGTVQLNVETYGGGLWYSWFDRDLSIAGRVITRKQINNESHFDSSIVHISRPILRIPSLCIHLKTPEEMESFKVNKEDHLVPILCGAVKSSLSSSENKTREEQTDTWQSDQPIELLDVLAEELHCRREEIADFELSLYDTQPAAITGARREYLCSSRIDNLASCFVEIDALIDHSSGSNLDEDEDVSLVALFDHEEVGSGSNVGAGSPLIRDGVARITDALASLSSQSDSSLDTLQSALSK